MWVNTSWACIDIPFENILFIFVFKALCRKTTVINFSWCCYISPFSCSPTRCLIPCANGWLPFSLICKESEFQDVQQQTIRPLLQFWPSWKLTAARNGAFFDQQRAQWKGILLSGRKKKDLHTFCYNNKSRFGHTGPTGSFETSYVMQETVNIQLSATQNIQLSHRFWKINSYWTNRPASKAHNHQ